MDSIFFLISANKNVISVHELNLDYCCYTLQIVEHTDSRGTILNEMVESRSQQIYFYILEFSCFLIATDLVIESHKTFKNEHQNFRIPNLVNIISFLLYSGMTSWNEGMYKCLGCFSLWDLLLTLLTLSLYYHFTLLKSSKAFL